MRVLIVKMSSLGDIVQTLPALHDLKAALPHATFDWLAEEAFAPLLETNAEGLADVIRIGLRRWRHSWLSAPTRAERRAFIARLQAHRYDAVLDFQGLIKSALVARRALLAPGGKRYTYGNRSEECGYEWPVRYMVDVPHPMPKRVHAVQRYRLLAAALYGGEPSGRPVYDLGCPRGGKGRDVMLAHGTTRADNEWPATDWIDIGRRLVANGWAVRLPHAGDVERAWAQGVCEGIGEGAQLMPRMSLAELPARMAEMAGVIGVDSGLSQLAVALDLPHVQLFSQPRAWRAGPVGTPHQLPVGGERAPDADAVWQAWQAVWAAAPRAVESAVGGGE
ncbi:MAG: lipopolysaccharide heptosyltransferase [Rhizobacter sp.]|nr:lipopolysaccharide heptosyltransferase [Rhizobacter sp.]